MKNNKEKCLKYHKVLWRKQKEATDYQLEIKAGITLSI